MDDVWKTSKAKESFQGQCVNCRTKFSLDRESSERLTL